jgi:hypothetical protein
MAIISESLELANFKIDHKHVYKLRTKYCLSFNSYKQIGDAKFYDYVLQI